MTFTLGIHVGPEMITAALAEGDPPRARAVPLGSTDLMTASAVAAGSDGAVLVGDAAAVAEGPTVTDALHRAGRGRTGALTAIITHVVGRAATAAGRAPNRLAIVIPDDFEAIERDNVVAAANAAGFTDVGLVPESLATARGHDAGHDTRHAIGAALVGSFDAPPPLVTAEDLGQMTVPEEPRGPQPVSGGPVSVFDEPIDPAVPPVRMPSEPVAARAARPRPATPAAAPAAMVAPPPLRPVPPRSVPVGAVIIAIALVIGAVIVVIGRSGGSETSDVPATTTTGAASTTTTAAVVTTTTAVPTTTSSATSSSTTSTSTTSSSSTTTTTTTPVRVASPGPVTLAETGLEFDTGSLVQFGQSEEVVLAEIEQVLGSPERDSGPIPNDFCSGPTARFVRYGNLELVFTSSRDDPESSLVFTQWYADGHLDPTGLVTPEGFGESSTVGFIEVTFPGAFVLVPPFEGDIVGIFAITNPQTGGVINGTTLGLDPEGVVTTLWAGDSCTRVFT